MHKSKYDDIYEHIGNLGAYQLFVFLVLGSTNLIQSFVTFSFIFAAATPEFRCKVPHLDADKYHVSNDSHLELVKYHIPVSKGSNQTLERCLIHVKNVNDKPEKCKSWVYSSEYYESTLVTEWNLVCDEAHFKSLYLTLLFIGTFGGVLIGYLSDKCGRKKTIYIFIVINSILCISQAVLFYLNLNKNITKILFGVLRILLGASSSLYSVLIVMGPTKRVLASNIIGFSYVIGNLLLTLTSYYVRDFRLLNVITAAIPSLFVFFFWIVPESPRWLISQHRFAEADRVFKTIAKSNKKSTHIFNELELFRASLNTNKNTTDMNFNKSVKIFVGSHKLFTCTLVFLINFISVQLVFNGVSFFTGDLAGNPYLNFALSNIFELIAIILLQLSMERYGRKRPYCLSISIASVAFFVIQLVPEYTTILVFVGKCAISFSFNSLYTITSEYYPTVLRSSITSIIIAISRLGGIICPYIQLLGVVYWPPIPFIIFGVCGCISAILFAIFVPETKNRKLRETLDEFL